MTGVIIDIFQFIVIIILICLQFLTARLAIRTSREQSRLTITQEPYKEPQPICGCTHHQCFHDDNGCGQQAVRYDGTMIVACGCKRYTGPEPLPQIIS